MNRWAWFSIGLALSLTATVALWSYGAYGLFLFLLLPLSFWPRRSQ